MCQPQASNRGCSEDARDSREHGAPPWPLCQFIPYSSSPAQWAASRCMNVAGECSGVRAECQEEPRRCRGQTRQQCRVPPGSRLLGVWTSFLHLWARTTCPRANQGTFRHLAAHRKGTLKGLNPVSTASMEKNRVFLSFFFFFSLQNITFFPIEGKSILFCNVSDSRSSMAAPFLAASRG